MSLQYWVISWFFEIWRIKSAFLDKKFYKRIAIQVLIGYQRSLLEWKPFSLESKTPYERCYIEVSHIEQIGTFQKEKKHSKDVQTTRDDVNNTNPIPQVNEHGYIAVSEIQ